MTDYDMTICVRAWQVQPDGSLPDEAIPALASYSARSLYPERGWRWFVPFDADFERGYTARPGDWIVQTRYGLEAMSDRTFRERCTEAQS